MLRSIQSTTHAIFINPDWRIQRSTDGGITWQQILGKAYETFGAAIASDGSTFYTTFDSMANHYLLYTTNDGSTWDTLTPPADETAQSMAVRDSILVVANSQGIWVSSDHGLSWRQFRTGSSAYSTLLIWNQTLFAVWDDSIYSTPLDTPQWYNVSDGIYAGKGNLTRTIAAGENGYMFAGTDLGIWKRPISQMVLSVPSPGAAALPVRFSLYQNYPNPFNPSTVISYALPGAMHVSLRIYSLLGELVQTIVDDSEQPGIHQVLWDGSNISSGVYFYRLTTGTTMLTKKMLLVK